MKLPGLRLIINPALQFATAQVDMNPASGLISALREETQRLARENTWIPALRARIMWGEDEKVVLVDKFQYDSDTIISGKDHVSICKPTRQFLEPLAFVNHGEYSQPTAV